MHQELSDRRRTRVLEDLRNEDPVTRRTAAWLAARLSIAEAEVLLVERLCTDQSDVRAAAAFALGELRVPRTIPALIAALEHGDFDVRSTAGWALVRFGEQAIPSRRVEHGTRRRGELVVLCARELDLGLRLAHLLRRDL
jgi:HEAT repeat protein